MVRAASSDVHLIKQLLDIGAQNLLTPMVDTAEQARQLVLATQYPPLGLRGVGRMVARSSRWAARTYSLDVADAEICLLVQAESVLALENLEEICAVDGVDGVFIGPADLAASMGYLGQPFHPKVQATIEGAITTIVKSGKAAGTLMSDPKVARRYLALGATFVATGVDVWSSPTLRANWRQTLWRPTWEHTGPRLHPLARATQQASIFRACEFA